MICTQREASALPLLLPSLAVSSISSSADAPPSGRVRKIYEINFSEFPAGKIMKTESDDSDTSINANMNTK
jgi:hypothetical protein